jgi:hypothetical protein
MRGLSDDARSEVDDFLKESEEDYVGLWQVVGAARDREATIASVEGEVLDMVRALLANGLLVGNLTREGGFTPWADQHPDAVTGRIHAEWQALGKDPSIDDICWFHLPRPPG